MTTRFAIRGTGEAASAVRRALAAAAIPLDEENPDVLVRLDAFDPSSTVEQWWVETCHGGPWPAARGEREMRSDLPLTHLRVCGALPGSVPRVLADADANTAPYLVGRQRARVDALATETLVRAARARARGAERVGAPCSLPTPAAAPTRAEQLRGALRSARRMVGVQVDQTVRSDHWEIGVADAPVHRFLDPAFRPAVDWLRAPSTSEFEADPTGVERADGGIDVFYEAFDYRAPVGRLCHAAWHPSGWERLGDVLVEETHLSFPSVVAWRGGLLGFPENAPSGQIAVYEVDDPECTAGRWHDRVTLVDFPGLDPTVFEWGGCWWLLATDGKRLDVDALHVWHAPGPMGPWTPHPGNPVRVGVDSVRPAGRPFVHEGVLYRPTQDGTGGYGSGVAIVRVDALDTSRFVETVVRRIAPLEGHDRGIHTLWSVGERTLVDGKRRVVIPATLPGRLGDRTRALRRLLGR